MEEKQKEQTRQYDEDKHETQIKKKDPHKKERSVRKLLEGLNMFEGIKAKALSM